MTQAVDSRFGTGSTLQVSLIGDRQHLAACTQASPFSTLSSCRAASLVGEVTDPPPLGKLAALALPERQFRCEPAARRSPLIGDRTG